MRQRWLIYILVGVVFGVFDFYYQLFLVNDLLHMQWGSLLERLVLLMLMFGIFLIPVMPIVLYEAKISRSIWLSALAAAGTWSVSIIAYYLYNVAQLAFIGDPSWPGLHISSRNDPYFWLNWQSMLSFLLVDNIIWMVVALVGGATIGLLLSTLYLRLSAGKSHPL